MLSGPPARVGRLDQVVGQVVEGGPGQDLFDPLQGQRVGQPVRAQQQHIPFHHHHRGAVGPQAVVHPQRPGDDVFLGVVFGLFGGVMVPQSTSSCT